MPTVVPFKVIVKVKYSFETYILCIPNPKQARPNLAYRYSDGLLLRGIAYWNSRGRTQCAKKGACSPRGLFYERLTNLRA